MRHILAPENRVHLARVASLPSLLAFDFDGTLAPFSADPSQARMRPTTRALFHELATSRPCAVVSGRAHADLATQLQGLPVAALVGNHGIEPDAVDASFARVIADARARLEAKLDPIPGVYLEDKTFTLALHYRHAPDRHEARARIDDAVRGLRTVRAISGELVVNLVPKDAPHKGAALLRLIESMVFAAAIYVGDDETDEDVFRLEGPPEVLTVRVGYSTTTRAGFFLEHQDEVDLLLGALLQPA